MELCESIIDGEKLPSDISSAIKNKLAPFVGLVRKLRREALKVSCVFGVELNRTGCISRQTYPNGTGQDHLRGPSPKAARL